MNTLVSPPSVPLPKLRGGPENLPGAALARLDRLQSAVDDLSAMARAGQARNNEAHRRVGELARRLAAVEESYSSNPAVRETVENQRQDAARALADAKAEAARLKQAADAKAAAWHAAGASLARLQDYVDDLTRTVTAFTGKVAPAGDLASIRARLAALDEAAESIRIAPVPAGEAIAAANAEIDALAARGAPDLARIIDGRVGIGWPETALPTSPGVIPDTLALLAWVHAPALKAAVGAAIKRQSDDSVSIPASARPARLAAIRAERLKTEREEEALIAALPDLDAAAARRPDADPRAVLGLADDAPVPRW